MGRVAIMVLAMTVQVAVAQPKPEGTRLFEEGRALAKQGNYDLACEKFKQSLAIDRAPGTSLNHGDCLEHLGQLRRAYGAFDEAATAFEREQDPRAKFARERAAAVLQKLGTLVVKVVEPTAPGLIVELGGQSVPPQPEILERFDPGEVTIVARVPGREPFTASARIVAGTTVLVEIPAFVVTVVSAPPVLPAVVRGARSPRRVRLAVGLGIGGGVALGVSVVVGLRARSLYDDAAGSDACTMSEGRLVCTAEAAAQIDKAGNRADLATGMAIVSGALLTSAIILYVTAPRETLTVSPTATASSVGVTLSSRF